jgi:hypothetical protein
MLFWGKVTRKMQENVGLRAILMQSVCTKASVTLKCGTGFWEGSFQPFNASTFQLLPTTVSA